jgi:ribonuclease D
MADPPVLTDTASLVRLAAELELENAIGVDLEADSMHSYQEKVCLLQFSTPSRTVLVDPLAIGDLAPLRPVMADPTVRKIFHAADYDIRCLFRDYRIKVRGLFDTMVSAQFLGEKKVGLADMLDKYFNVKLDKKYQRANWSARPLSKAMVCYAAEDTRYLHQLMELLETKLAETGRRSWVAEEFQLLEQVRHNDNNGPLFLRIKGAWKLDRPQLAVLEALLHWRDREAERRDCPLFKVIGNKTLLELARATPCTREGLQAVQGMPPPLADRYGNKLARVIEKALATPQEKLPLYPSLKRPAEDRAADARLRLLKRWRTRKAAQLSMEPGIVINTALLEAIARKPPAALSSLSNFSAMKNWQRQELGPEIVAALQ